MKNLYLTKTGLLFVTLGDQSFFSNDGIFRRKASRRERNYIIKEEMAIKLEQNASIEILVQKMEEFVSNIGEWQFLTSKIVQEDDYSYDPTLCNNGGAYGFWIKRTFLYRNKGKEIEIVSIDTQHTTAEFNYCEITGTFSSNVKLQEFEDFDGMKIYSSQPLGVVEQYCTKCTVEDIFKMEKTYIHPREDDREDSITPLFSLTEKKEILRILKENGWKKSPKKKQLRRR